jgi:alanine dehydrogenase
MSTLVINHDAVKVLMTMPDVIDVVEDAFRMLGEGKANMPAKAYLLVEQGDFRAMPAALPGCAGMKWVNAHPDNSSRDLPSVMAILVYNDPDTGYPLAILDATEVTAYRTGAASALASKYLARRDSRTLGIVGAGCQAHTQIAAHAELFDLAAINVFDISDDAVRVLIDALPGYPVKSCSVEEAVASDIVCSLTPSRAPVVKRDWILPGTHINAVGADGAGKQELEPDILSGAVVVVDDTRQAVAGGEINVPIKKGLFKSEQIYGTLAELVTGVKQGRTDDKAVTVFDSTGIAIEDIAVARLIYEKALKNGGCPSIDLIGI